MTAKALEKNRDARHQTVPELRADLEILKREVDPKYFGAFCGTYLWPYVNQFS